MSDTFSIRLSALDTMRFGIPIARATLQSPEQVAIMREQCDAQNIKMAILRCEVTNIAAMQHLEAVGAFLTDTLLYFESAITTTPSLDMSNVTIRSATVEDAEVIQNIATICFHNYQGHYHADPRLDRRACDAIYVDWAVRSVITEGVASVVLLAQDSTATTVGFTTLNAIADDTYDIGLTAVHPHWHGQGINQNLLHRAQAWCYDAKAHRLTISTQISNIASQRSAVRAGFIPQRAFYTLHWWF